MPSIRVLLYPIASLFGAILRIRHFLYDKNIFKSYSPPTFTVCVGNLRVGGTGKTPHTEWLIAQFLHSKKSVAVLSRGYGRVTKGYREVTLQSTASEVGDEPLQIKKKYPHISVHVCEKRKIGIENIEKKYAPNIIILDDAMQHRAVKARKYLLLTTFAQPYNTDFLLPYGGLRDLRKRSKIADIIIVTKTPKNITTEDKTKYKQALNLLPHQILFFSHYAYGFPINMSGDVMEWNKIDSCLLIAAIANPKPFIENVSSCCNVFSIKLFRDHHRFSCKEVDHLKMMLDKHDTLYILTTEKDIQRLAEFNFTNEQKLRILYLPIEVQTNLPIKCLIPL